MKEYEFCVDVGCSANYQTNPLYELLFVFMTVNIVIFFITALFIKEEKK